LFQLYAYYRDKKVVGVFVRFFVRRFIASSVNEAQHESVLPWCGERGLKGQEAKKEQHAKGDLNRRRRVAEVVGDWQRCEAELSCSRWKRRGAGYESKSPALFVGSRSVVPDTCGRWAQQRQRLYIVHPRCWEGLTSENGQPNCNQLSAGAQIWSDYCFLKL
jgi:hypothetical protein